ncbi:tetratricopeptide repeat protein [Tropicibacter oceani]|uniref:Tetratricopeptide repeat protein n=1 Tax=Tropicibacter oceani TaxID=3058420 RepID=A0ABY8QLG5_9RHOB|nr:tetratricopeptide repeat protein [Tropicibacter oceani]WGW04838.1 tetratricopeptide repeat protein [Tropicibacter oceani]
MAIRAGVLAAALVAPQGAFANGVAGDYLAARQASFDSDYKAAARYYGRAILFDPGKPELLERAILANIALGEIEIAAGLADKLSQDGIASQLAQMAQVARDAKAENYIAVLKAINENKGFGPLSDGLAKAWAQLGQGDMTAALVAFDVVSGVQGLGPLAIYHKALALASVGDFESAEALFAADSPGGMGMTRRGVMARAEILSQLDRNKDAIDLLDTAFGRDLDPGLSTMRAALEKGETLTFTHVRSARDGLAEVMYTLGSALAAESGGDLTLVYSRLAEYLRPEHVDAVLLIAEQLDDMGQYELAVEAYGHVPADAPAYHAAELGRAEALRAQDRPEEAAAVLEALTQTHGDLPVVHSAYADLMRQMEQFDKAAAAYTRALDLFTEVTERQWFLYYARGICFERSDQWDKAEADFRKALELSPEQPNVLNYLGYSLVEKKIKLDEALDMIERAVAAQPNSGYIVDSLGWVLYRLGRYEEAVAPMVRAAELMPIDPIVNDHLGDVFWAVGREMEARFMWKRALSFVDWEDAAEEADPERIKRKIEVGLDVVLAEEGAPPLQVANEDAD